MAEPVVETQKLTKIFLDFWGRKKKVALRALDIKVNQGELRRNQGESKCMTRLKFIINRI